MPRVKLTQHVADRLPAPTATGKQELHWDADLKGFAILCSGKTATKTYIAQRDLPGSGNSRRVTIASTSEIKFAEAKDRARKLLLDMRDGKDPKAKPSTGTLQETLEAYLLASPRLSPRSVRQYRDLVRIQLSSLKNKPLGSITPQEVDALHRQIKGKTVANHALRCLRMLHRWAAARDDDLGRSPVRLRRGEWHQLAPRRNPIPAGQLRLFYYAVLSLPDMGRDYVTLCLFTGMRRKEAAGLRWSEVDFDNRVIRLSASRVKTRNAVALPMTDVVFDLLVARRQLGDAEFVFPSRGEGHISGDAWTQTLCQKTGLKFSMHDTRRTYATVGEACGIPFLALKALLNHAISGSDITIRYIGMDVERLRAPAQTIADRMKSLIGMTPLSGNVQALR